MRVLVDLSIIVSLVAFVVPSSAATISKYHFMQIHHELFATDGTQVWHVAESRAQAPDNASSAIRLQLVGPYPLWTVEDRPASSLLITGRELKLVFVAKFAPACTFLVFVDGEDNYRGWSVRLYSRFFRKSSNKTREGTRGPFKLVPPSGCAGRLVSTFGRLRDLPDLKPLIRGTNRSLASVVGNRNNTVLYFIQGGTGMAVRLNLTKWDPVEGIREFGYVRWIQRAANQTKTILATLRDKYALCQVDGSEGIEICPLKSLARLELGVACRPILIEELNAKQGSVEESKIQQRSLLGDPDYDGTTQAPGLSPLVILLIVVVCGVCVVMIVYMLVAAYCCANSTMIMMPTSALNSRFTQKIRSTSSIKTIDSDRSPSRAR